MNRELYCLLVREGTSDDGLVSPLTALLIDLGYNPNSQILPQANGGSKRTVDVLRRICDEGQTPDIVFVHRDADNDGHELRETEISDAYAEVAPTFAVVPVVPVKMTEAWVLHALHNKEYRRKIDFKGPLDKLPKQDNIPGVAAKDRLHEIHAALSEGRRRRKRSSPDRFTTDRSRWVEQITDVSFLEGCTSFERVRQAIRDLHL
ncbi:hypothetical protein [Corynebacterium sp. HMSC04H06]|uniref:hypothetical protein n=1 Tax=Corynebacterium sp. HMSC04H06 TaxID=1581050 RepID=UPI00114CCBE6|nr:hypothetical protein [Corynebacterium sp. HMSC04H06]